MTESIIDSPPVGGGDLYRVAGVRELEALAFRDTPSAEVMERAGRAAADWLAGRAASRRRVAILAGPGNNGGDGVVAARYLHQRGFEIAIVARAGTAEAARGDAAQAWSALPRSIPVLETPDELDPEIVLDALFGIGLGRPLEAPYADWVRWSNGLRPGVLRLAIDVPSGLDADLGTRLLPEAAAGARGTAAADAAFRADATITFIADKPGLHTADGPDCCGDVRVEPLGLDRSGWPAPDGRLVGAYAVTPSLRSLRRARNTHKGSFGALGLVGGYAGTVGALLLAARAGLRLGAGRVYVGFVPQAPLACDPTAPELMLRSAAAVAELDCEAIAVGPGLGREPPGRDALEAALATTSALVVDADALNLLAAHPPLRQALRSRSAPAILTPHPLEAARLLESSASAVQADRIGAATRLAADTGCVVALKGMGTVVAEPGGQWWINGSGGPALATGGTGDVLTGMIGALLAQGLSARDACLAAVWLHGRAADHWVEQAGGEIGLAASELIDHARALANMLSNRLE